MLKVYFLHATINKNPADESHMTVQHGWVGPVSIPYHVNLNSISADYSIQNQKQENGKL